MPACSQPKFHQPAQLAFIALAGLALLAGCGERSAAPPTAVAPAASTQQAASVAAAYLSGAEIQAENDGQLRELRRALADLLEKPATELRDIRYAAANGEPGKRDLVLLLRGHLVPAAAQPLDAETLYAEKDRPEVRAAVQKTLDEIDRRLAGIPAAASGPQG